MPIRSDALLLTAAAEATRLLQSFGIDQASEIQLDDIAWALGIEVMTGPLVGADARLVRCEENGTILVSDRLRKNGDRRFAIAHELGHWRMHGTVSQLFFCTEKDLREYRDSGQELEANTFASELLMPKAMISPDVLKAEPSWEIIRSISDGFAVSPISAAIRYAELAHQPVMAVFSNGENVHWWRENRSRMAGLWLESRQKISEESLVYHEAKQFTGDWSLQQVPWESWFPHIDADEDEELWEFATPLDEVGTMLSLLWVPSRC